MIQVCNRLISLCLRYVKSHVVESEYVFRSLLFSDCIVGACVCWICMILAHYSISLLFSDCMSDVCVSGICMILASLLVSKQWLLSVELLY